MKWHHYIYKIVCDRNGMVYYGVHSTQNLQDGYMGSGSALAQAKKLYGPDAFHKEILCWCDSRQKALEVESLIVNKNDQNTYNRCAGGAGGISSYDVENSPEVTPEYNQEDCFIDALSDLHGQFDIHHIFDYIKRNPHWYDSIRNTRDLKRQLERYNDGKRFVKVNQKLYRFY